MDIDRLNSKILQELRSNGRLSNVELAQRVGLSTSACLRRVQELERSGVIAGYRAVIDGPLAGKGFVAYVTVGLSDHSKAAQKVFERAIENAPQVSECHNITGAVEYLLRIEVADIAAYKVLHTELIGTIPAVRSITTFVVVDSPKDQRG